jgi:HPt (histidine-containing phosphotransfer) domain-containing protein
VIKFAGKGDANMQNNRSSTAPVPVAPAIPTGDCRPKEAIERLGGMMELYGEVVDRFLNDEAGTILKLHTATNLGDLVRARDAAHSLKGMAAMCGAVSVAGVAAAIEQVAQTGHFSTLASLSKRLDTEMSNAKSVLSAYRHRTQPPGA